MTFADSGGVVVGGGGSIAVFQTCFLVKISFSFFSLRVVAAARATNVAGGGFIIARLTEFFFCFVLFKIILTLVFHRFCKPFKLRKIFFLKRQKKTPHWPVLGVGNERC